MRKPTLLILAVALLLGACSTYKVTISQGNVVQNDKLAQLKAGMTPVQVQFLLGTPLLRSELSPDRWDYVLLIRRGEETLSERRVSVQFENGVVSKIEDSQPPAEPTAEDEEPAPATDA